MTDIEAKRWRAMERYYPWLVLGIAFLTVATALGTRSAFAVFLVAVIEEFHWSRASASGVLLLGSVVWTIAAPMIGVLLDRFGPRTILAAGAVVMGLGFFVSGLTRTILQFYLGMGLLVGLGFAALPMTAQATFISNWFVRKRGMAMGITASGIGIGILVVVPLTQLLISQFGWRQAYFCLAALLTLFIAPLNFFFQKRRPEDLGLSPDFGGVTASVPTATATKIEDRGMTLRQALSTLRFWALAMGVFTGAMPLHMVLIHQVAAVTDSGLSKELAAFILGLVGLFTSPAMIFMGALSDRIGREWAYTLGSAAMIAGILFLAYVRDPMHAWGLYVFAPFFAFGFASRQSLYPTIAADLFHGSHFGAIIGTIALFIGAGAGIGPWLGGYVYDRTASYLPAFGVAVMLVLVSLVFIWIAGPGRRHFSTAHGIQR